jgi:hypothetical protein
MLKLNPIAEAKATAAGICFETLDELKDARTITQLYYGGSGVGKTMYVGSAGPRTLIVNIGNGIVTIRSPEAKRRYYKDGKMPIVVTIREEIDKETKVFKVARAFDQVEEAIVIGLDHFADQFDTIAIDDASYLRTFAMNKGLEMSDELNKSQSLKKGRETGAIMFAVQDYGAEMKLIEDFVTQTIDFCKDAGKHLLLTAHERWTWRKIRDQQGKVIGEEVDKVKPGFTGRTFPDDVTKHFDLVWRADVVQANPLSVYRAQTEMSKGITAKSRYPGVFESIEKSPNFLAVVARIHKSLNIQGAPHVASV